MMKKLIRLIAVFALLTQVLCGCAEAPAGGDTTGNAADPTQTTGNLQTDPTGTTAMPTDPVDDGKQTYTVTVVDQNGNGVAKVAVQFCDESGTCQMPVKTNDQGVVTKSLAPQNYHVKLTLPEGYSCDTLEYDMAGITELRVSVTAD